MTISSGISQKRIKRIHEKLGIVRGIMKFSQFLIYILCILYYIL